MYEFKKVDFSMHCNKIEFVGLLLSDVHTTDPKSSTGDHSSIGLYLARSSVQIEVRSRVYNEILPARMC